jgi:hypothetical protein
MSNIIQGETIPMTYPKFFDIQNEEQDTTNNSLSNNLGLGKEILDDNKNYSRSTTKQSINNVIKHFIKKKDQKKMPYRSSNQPTFLRTNNSHSELLALPIEEHLSGNTTSIIRGETITMARYCFSENQWNIHQVILDYSSQGFSLKQLIRSGKSRRRKRNDEVNKFRRKSSNR